MYVDETLKIINLQHPDFQRNSWSWNKFRKVYEGGQNFISEYLIKYSNREDHNEFVRRKSITYSPSFAKMAINEIRNAICQRMPDIIREGGPDTFISAAAGIDGGVNMEGSSMNLFMAEKVLPELLSIGRVGVFVDMPSIISPTLAGKNGSRPYTYIYKAEQIRSWTYDDRRPDRLISVLLEDAYYKRDKDTDLIMGIEILYRHLWIQDGEVNVQFYDAQGNKLEEDPRVLELEEIPFVLCDLPDSLLVDVADYQIALLNLESSDLAYILKSNYPFYTEQFDPRSESPYLKQPGVTAQEVFENRETGPAIVTYDSAQEVELGSAGGRRYPLGTERPNFIHPSSEPLTISMAKSDQLKKDIRLLVNLAVADLAKDASGNPLEAGLAIIGLKIESLERKIGELWTDYIGEKIPPTIHYPQTYSLKSEEERRKEATDLETLIAKVPSKTFQREIAKQIAEITVGHKVPTYTLEAIKKEIDKAEVVITDPDIIKTDLENGLVSVKLASKVRGYPEGEVEQAKLDHAERVSRIAVAQVEGAAAARGVGDLSSGSKGGETEKKVSRDTTQDPTPTDKTRGEGK